MPPIQRSFAGRDDLPAILDLFREMAAVDKGDLVVTPEDFEIEWIDDEPGWVRDLQVWEADGPLLAAFGCWHELESETTTAYAEIAMHPEWRSEQDVDHVLTALTAATATLVPVTVDLRFGASETQQWLVDGAERNGFTLDRIYFRMRTERSEPFTEIELPPGFVIRPLSGQGEVEAWVEAFNDAFASHHDAPTYTVAEKMQRLDDDSYMPTTDLVLVAPDGRFAGISLNTKEVLDDGEERVWVRSIGIRPEWRGTGLGRALLQTSINALIEHGFTTVRLSVDSDNATSALRLYKGTGFEVEFRRLVFIKSIAAA
jgi:mycothiol synthase